MPPPITMTATMYHSVETILKPARSSDAALPIQFIPGHALGCLQKMTMSTDEEGVPTRSSAGWLE